MTDRKRVAVVGGGIAGLAAALELCRAPRGPDVILVEAEGSFGGKLRLVQVGSRLVDAGPDSFVARRPEVFELCAKIGIASDIVGPGASGAEVYARGRRRRLPPGLAMGIPTRFAPLARSGLIGTGGLLRAALDLTGIPAAARRGHAGRRRGPDEGCEDEDWEDEAIGSIVERHFGREVKEVLADPLIGGIHASSTDNLSAASVFPPLLAASRKGSSLMRSLRASTAEHSGRVPPAQVPMFATLTGGMASIASRITEAMIASGATCLARARVEAIEREGSSWVLHLAGTEAPSAVGPEAPSAVGSEAPSAVGSEASAERSVRADGLVLAVPAFEAARLLRPHGGELADALATIPYASVSVATFLFDEEGIRTEHKGTGFLVPASSGLHMTACTWLDVKWPHLRQPLTRLVRVSAGRFGDIRHELLPEDELVDVLLGDLARTAGIARTPAEAVVTRWPDSFPQYRPGHAKLVSRIEQEASRFPFLALAGAAYQGIGVPACVKSGREAAGAILAGLERLGGEGLEERHPAGRATGL